MENNPIGTIRIQSLYKKNNALQLCCHIKKKNYGFQFRLQCSDFIVIVIFNINLTRNVNEMKCFEL